MRRRVSSDEEGKLIEERMQVIKIDCEGERDSEEEGWHWYSEIFELIEREFGLELHEIPNEGKVIENENSRFDFEILK